MSDVHDDQTLLVRRLTQLGLDSSDVDLPADATITPRTLARSSAPKLSAAASADELPRIALDRRDSSASEVGRERHADLELYATLGEGGMGRVHLARQRSLDRDVAVKTLSANALPETAGALLTEARLTGSLEHPGVIPVHALGIAEDGLPVLVMKRVAGVDLAALLTDETHAAWRDARSPVTRLDRGLEILVQVCRTVEFAHSRGVIHCDIKPENVMVGSFGEVYLVDWGVAKRIGANDEEHTMLVGTPVYMAPEMALGGVIDERTDVYLLGALLHAILVQRPRHEGGRIAEVLRAATMSAPVAYGPEVPGQLANLCNAATARDPARRPANVEAFRLEIADFLRHRAARALSKVAWERLETFERLLESAQGDAAPADLAGAYRLATEARFGFAQSLREHDGHRLARDGMRRCILASIELERRQEHLETAEVLLRELEDPPSEVSAKLDALRTRISGRRADHERLESLERDVDPTQQRGTRTAVLILLASAVVITWVTVLVTSKTTGDMPSARRVVAQSSATLIGMVVFWAVFRQRIMPNAFNRRMAAFLGLAATAAFANRLLGYAMDTPVATTLAQDLLSWSVAAAGGAIALTRRLWLACALMFAGFVTMKIHPHLVPFVVAVVCGFGAIIWAFALAKRDEARRQ